MSGCEYESMAARFKTSKRELGGIAILTLIFFVVDIGLFFEQGIIIPVRGAASRDWNPDAFWHPSWGMSGVHKGIDIFARRGTDALAAVSGVVVYQGELKLGGNVLVIFDSKWRLHYYAHLDSATVGMGDWVHQGSVVGKVGNTGNARGRPAHLHYSITSLIPHPGRYSDRTEGWKLMFYLNPADHLS
jgi:murein DD-endopeptidase MepM/ murein hydrolase activator NlpD